MKRITYTLIALVATVSFGGCQKNLDDNFIKDECFEIHATISSADGVIGENGAAETKVLIDDMSAAGGAVNLWTSTDKFYFICPNPDNVNAPFAYEYNIKNVTGTETTSDAIFTGTTIPTKWTSTEYLAYCPASMFVLPTSSQWFITDRVPKIQEYVLNGIHGGYIPMMAHGTNYQSLSFSSLVSILKVRVKQSDVSSGAEKVKKIVIDYPEASKTGSRPDIYARGWAYNCFFRLWKSNSNKGTNMIDCYAQSVASNNPSNTSVTLNVPDVELSPSAEDFYIVINARNDGDHGGISTSYHRGMTVKVTTDQGTYTVEKGCDFHFNPLANHIYTLPEINISGH